MTVCVVGGGPAGLAFAIEATLLGEDVVVIEQKTPPIDKACGEGLMPRGIERLRALGVLPLLERSHPVRGIRYVNEDGRTCAALLPHGGGLGIRRTVLSAALWQRARDIGVRVLHEKARWMTHGPPHEIGAGAVRVHADVLVAADGLHSLLREQAGLAVAATRPARFGLRCHFAAAPWSDFVEVYFAGGVEAYVTPVGPNEVGLAFLWTRGGAASFDSFFELFPTLVARIGTAERTSRPQGMGPLAQSARTSVGPGLALLGDAAGFVDAITGEGISLALEAAHDLALTLHTRRPLVSFARSERRRYRRTARFTRLLLALAHRPRLRRAVVRVLGHVPIVFRLLLRLVA